MRAHFFATWLGGPAWFAAIAFAICKRHTIISHCCGERLRSVDGGHILAGRTSSTPPGAVLSGSDGWAVRLAPLASSGLTAARGLCKTGSAATGTIRWPISAALLVKISSTPRRRSGEVRALFGGASRASSSRLGSSFISPAGRLCPSPCGRSSVLTAGGVIACGGGSMLLGCTLDDTSGKPRGWSISRCDGSPRAPAAGRMVGTGEAGGGSAGHFTPRCCSGSPGSLSSRLAGQP